MNKNCEGEQLFNILEEFLDQISDLVPEQQGGYDFVKERWISASERIEVY